MTMVAARIRPWLLRWTALTTVIFWLPTVRGAFDGSSYTWSSFGFGGTGITGDYWFPLAGTAIALLAQWLGWRGQARSVLYLLLGLWHGSLAVGSIFLAATEPADFRFQGDTLGVDMLPVQAFLLRSGPPDGVRDQAGVLLTIAQWLMAGRALRPPS